jgi:hypothetical protein
VNEPLTATRVILQFHAQHSLDPAGQQASLDSLQLSDQAKAAR